MTCIHLYLDLAQRRRVTAWPGLEGASEDVLVQPHAQSRLLRAMSSWILKISRDGRLHSVSGQPVPVFDHPHSRKALSRILAEFSATGSHWEEPGSAFPTASPQVFTPIDKISFEPSLL